MKIELSIFARQLTLKRNKCDMLKHSKNHQVIYSLNALSQSLYELMQKTPFEKIAVTQICQTAQITRRTFYRNCNDKLDLVDYLVQQYIRELLDSVDFTCTDTILLYQHFFQFWKTRHTFLTTLYQNNLFTYFFQAFTKCCIHWMEDRLMIDMLQDQRNKDALRLFYNSFIIGGLCNVLEPWTAEDFQTPIDDLVYVLTTLSPKYKGITT